MKKDLGDWGEAFLDEFMQNAHWTPLKKNFRMKHGEIDRVYIHKSLNNIVNLCVCEIKTATYHKKLNLDFLFTEVGIKRYIKQRQIRNIYFYAENTIASFTKNEKLKTKLYLRFFIIFKKKEGNNLPFFSPPRGSPIKKCFENNEALIFSVEPEFTHNQTRKSLLQIVV